jgi:hypothetical protein
VKQFLIELLKSLEVVIPPPKGCHHAITFARYGSSRAAWQDRLALQINREGKFYCFFLDEDDLPPQSQDPTRIVQFVAIEMRSRSDSEFQLGIGPGQYSI